MIPHPYVYRPQLEATRVAASHHRSGSHQAETSCMTHDAKAIDATVAKMQQNLDRDYPQLEWRVRFSPPSSAAQAAEAWVFVHARTRDFQYRCRVGRPWSAVAASPTLARIVADLAAEAERALAQLAAP